MPRHRRPPSQTWRTFLTNRRPNRPPIFRRADRHVSTPLRVGHPGARTTPRRARGGHGPSHGGMDRPTTPRGVSGDEVPRYLIRDRDSAFAGIGPTATGMGIHEVLTAPRSPWQKAYTERVIGSIRRECLDHVIVVNEIGLSRILTRYLAYTTSHGRISRWPRTRHSLGRSRDQRSARSSPFRRSAASTIATTVGRRSHTSLSLPGRRSWNGRRSLTLHDRAFQSGFARAQRHERATWCLAVDLAADCDRRWIKFERESNFQQGQPDNSTRPARRRSPSSPDTAASGSSRKSADWSSA